MKLFPTFHGAADFWQASVAPGTLNNTTPSLEFAVTVAPPADATLPFLLVTDPTGTPEVMEVRSYSGLNLSVFRKNPVAHAGAPPIYCAPVAENDLELQAAFALLEAYHADPPFSDPIAGPSAWGAYRSRSASQINMARSFI